MITPSLISITATGSEGLLADKRMQQIYEEACKEGTAEVYCTRIMLVGHFAAGKTSVKRSLLDEKFVRKYETTEGVETENTVNIFVTDVKEEGKGPFRWKKVTCDFLPYVRTNYG